MANFAYEVTLLDVEAVVSSNKLVAANTQDKSIESIAVDAFDTLDFDLIESAALNGDDLDEQQDYANDEIARQLREMGILEPVEMTAA